jgi:hypothetical protein
MFGIDCRVLFYQMWLNSIVPIPDINKSKESFWNVPSPVSSRSEVWMYKSAIKKKLSNKFAVSQFNIYKQNVIGFQKEGNVFK